MLRNNTIRLPVCGASNCGVMGGFLNLDQEINIEDPETEIHVLILQNEVFIKFSDHNT